MIKIYQKTITDKKLKILDQFRVGSWLCVENPSEEELKFLTKKFSLDSGLLEDALDPYEVPRVEIEKGNSYIFTRIPCAENEKIFTVPLLLVIGKDFLMTVSQKTLPFLGKFTSGKINFFTTQKTRLFRNSSYLRYCQ